MNLATKILPGSLSLNLTLVSLVLIGLSTLLPINDIRSQGQELVLSVPSGPYVTIDEAIIRVETKIEEIKPQFDNLIPGTQEYRDLQAEVDFYVSILENLNSGHSVQAAIEAGLQILNSDAHSTVSKEKRYEFRQEAIDLLRP